MQVYEFRGKAFIDIDFDEMPFPYQTRVNANGNYEIVLRSEDEALLLWHFAFNYLKAISPEMKHAYDALNAQDADPSFYVAAFKQYVMNAELEIANPRLGQGKKWLPVVDVYRAAAEGLRVIEVKNG